MKKTILMLAMLLCSMVFSTNVLAEAGGVAATDDVKRVRVAGDTWSGCGYPSPFAFGDMGPGYVRMSMLFDTLTWKDANGVVPSLADGWRVSNDGERWTFYLDRNARWHDGELFTADDVEFTFDYMKDCGAFTWYDPSHIDSVYVVDDYTVVITLNDPMASFLVDIAGNVPMIPEHIWYGVSDPVKFKDDDAAIGTGPLKLVEYNPDVGSYLYEANYDYYDGNPIVDEVISIAVSNPASALKAREVDEIALWGSDIDAAVILAADPDFKVITGQSLWVLNVYFNCERYPMNITEFRQAVAYGIDREEIVEQTLHGGGMIANTGIMHPDSIWCNPECEVYEYDVDAANNILDSLGFTNKIDGIRQYPAGGNLEFELHVLYYQFLREAELIQGQLEDIGIKTEIKNRDWAGIYSCLEGGNFDMALLGYGGISNPKMLRNPNWPASTYHDDDYDSLFEEQETTMDFDSRKELVNQLQEKVADDLPVYALYHPYVWCAYDPDVLDTWFYTREGISTGIPIELNKLAFLARYGDANENGKINMQDVTKIERIILRYDESTEMADANQNDKINMQDVTHIELIILGRAPIRIE